MDPAAFSFTGDGDKGGGERGIERRGVVVRRRVVWCAGGCVLRARRAAPAVGDAAGEVVFDSTANR